jgi:peptidoglycan/LPS O-acetylase OafA/YrhL
MSPIAHAFSLRRNLTLLTTPPARRHFHPIDGMRALAVLWIIVMHCVWFQFPFLKLEDWTRRMDQTPRWIIGGPYGVDVFFVISGFLIGYILMKEHKECGAIDIPRFYLRRFLKLMPAYFVALGVYCATVRENWQTVWANLIYINNFLPGAKQAMTWTWSLAIEEQFYFTFPCFLAFIFFRMRRRRMLLLGALLALACGIRFWIAWAHGMSLPIAWSAGVTDARFLDWAERMYIKPYTRYGCLLTGVMAAYLCLFADTKGFFARRRMLAGWIFGLSAATFGAVLAVPMHVASPVWPRPQALAALSLDRYLLGAAVSYMLLYSLFAETVVGRAFRYFLSARIWYVGAQLAYSAYLLHPIVLLTVFGALAGRNLLTIPMPLLFAAGPALSFLAAAPLHLLIERPFMNLRDAASPRPQRSRPTVHAGTAPAAEVSVSAP